MTLDLSTDSRSWQKRIRDQRAEDDADVDLFGRWWEGLDLTLSTSEVRRIDAATAELVIRQYEWLGTMPAIIIDCFGLFFAGHLGGVVVYSPEYAENLGVWDRYGFTGKIICLSRGACAHWTPKGSASRLIRRSMDLLPPRFEVVTATCDSEAGEVGTIYQACNFLFVGQMSEGGKRSSYAVQGERRSGRQAKRDFGTRGGAALAELGADDVQMHSRKTRYFCFRGSRKVLRQHKKAIDHLVKPYPKREAS